MATRISGRWKTLGGVALIGAGAAASGCNDAGGGALSGAALGAGAGAIIGSLGGNLGEGAAIGAVGGALGGAVIGDQNQRRSRESRDEMYYYGNR